MVFGMLLGPERTRGLVDRVFHLLGKSQRQVRNKLLIMDQKVFAVVALVFWWLFENCTVDASIFVVKFLRAHGGCLGIRSR